MQRKEGGLIDKWLLNKQQKSQHSIKTQTDQQCYLFEIPHGNPAGAICPI